MEELLKGNFKVKNAVVARPEEAPQSSSEKLARELRVKALNALGGSMVYVDRTDLQWDGDGPAK